MGPSGLKNLLKACERGVKGAGLPGIKPIRADSLVFVGQGQRVAARQYPNAMKARRCEKSRGTTKGGPPAVIAQKK
jgi:hypothetical protein